MDRPVTRRTVLGSVAVGAAGVIGVTGCSILPGERVPESAENPAFGAVAQRGDLDLSSPAILENGRLPSEYGHSFGNVNPPLVVDGVPPGTDSLSLIMEGPDVPGGAIVHWLVWNIPPAIGTIPEGWDPPAQVVQGANSSGAHDHGYVGPSPPNRQTTRFKLYALDTTLELRRGASKQALGVAMKDHVLGQTQLTAWYDFHTAAHDTISRRPHVNVVDDVCHQVPDRPLETLRETWF